MTDRRTYTRTDVHVFGVSRILVVRMELKLHAWTVMALVHQGARARRPETCEGHFRD